MHLELLTTEHCSLCEQALDLLLSSGELRGLALKTTDIAFDAVLLDEFGERIPVLRAGARCLDWPFTVEEVLALRR